MRTFISNSILTMLGATIIAAGAARADSWVVQNPDGSTTQTQVSPSGQTLSTRTEPAARAQGVAPGTPDGSYRYSVGQPDRNRADRDRYYGDRDRGDRDRGRGSRDGRGDDRGRVDTYTTYPAYPYSYELPSGLGTGPWITSIPTPGVGVPTYSYPYAPQLGTFSAYPYYGYGVGCGGYPAYGTVQGYQSYNLPLPGYSYPYGNGSYNSYGSFGSYGYGAAFGAGSLGGPRITYGGTRTTVGSGRRH